MGLGFERPRNAGQSVLKPLGRAGLAHYAGGPVVTVRDRVK